MINYNHSEIPQAYRPLLDADFEMADNAGLIHMRDFR